MHFHKAQEKPQRWGNFQDVQYAIRKNAEKIYQVDSDGIVLCMPLFWGLPPLDYSGFNNHGTNHGAVFKDGGLDFDGTNYINTACAGFDPTANFTILAWINGDSFAQESETHRNILSQQDGTGSGKSLLYIFATNDHAASYLGGVKSESLSALSVGTDYLLAVTYNASTNNIVIHINTDGGKTTGGITGGPANGDLVIGAHKLLNKGRWDGAVSNIYISNVDYTADQIAMFYDRLWDLYRPVSKPVYSLPAVGVTIPVFMQNMRGGFNPISRGGFIN
jgi:hypothetical protein